MFTFPVPGLSVHVSSLFNIFQVSEGLTAVIMWLPQFQMVYVPSPAVVVLLFLTCSGKYTFAFLFSIKNTCVYACFVSHMFLPVKGDTNAIILVVLR